jgi:hypothetical protein
MTDKERIKATMKIAHAYLERRDGKDEIIAKLVEALKNSTNLLEWYDAGDGDPSTIEQMRVNDAAIKLAEGK